MKVAFKNNFWGYFKFFYKGTGYRLFVNFFLCITVSFFDGMGLTMFMPLLQAVGDNGGKTGGKSLGQLHYLTDAIKSLGFELNLNTVLSILFILFLVKGLVKFVQLNYQVVLRQSFVKRLRFNLAKQLQQLSYRGFLQLDSGKIQNIFTTEMLRLYQSIFYYFNAAQSVVMLFTYIILAFLANYQFALLVGTGAALSNLFYRKVYIATKRTSVSLSKKGNKFNSFLIQAISNFKYLKSTNYFSLYSVKLREVITQTETLYKKIGFYNSITKSLKEPSIIIIVLIVIKVQLTLMGASLSSILLSLLLFYRALALLVDLQNNWQQFINNVGAINAVSKLSEQMEQQKEVQRPTLFHTFQHELHIKDVVFSYGAHKVLDGINIRIPKNQTIAMVGESGSGKTTLANIIASLIAPDSGQILADSVSLHEYNLDSYRNKIGYISQESVIFNDNIFNNITFWDEPSPENIKHFSKVIELVSLNEFIESLPEKEFTPLGDNGILISGGQRQRISIARELYKKAEILILDEATSALDSETERVVRTNIDKLHGNYTIIIIAHRLSTIKNADKIYLLDKGKISASGKFDDMLEFSERFKRMVALQEI
ncbi:ABC transporter ATP-binding protein [Ilyomonas limi]|uniref:ABC transporter ATP-binding protein n=1 Tax=Ilyomonas limi TaxID=2575867 RepID=A0A4U3L1B2_9BACT|nr:ABC transporter ATP-binding protein [Ilyomonas limi]TKK67984.1 ABC transporter ATP-binding protein [Ilyomonas limi]